MKTITELQLLQVEALLLEGKTDMTKQDLAKHISNDRTDKINELNTIEAERLIEGLIDCIKRYDLHEEIKNTAVELGLIEAKFIAHTYAVMMEKVAKQNGISEGHFWHFNYDELFALNNLIKRLNRKQKRKITKLSISATTHLLEELNLKSKVTIKKHNP